MGMTMTQKILAKHAGKEVCAPGDLIEAKLDLLLGNDITTPPAIDIFEKNSFGKVFDTKKIVLVPDHFAPNKDIKSAEQCKRMRDFARSQNIKYYYEQGQEGMGVEHVILPDNGLVLPGFAVIGADSHTCTYGALGAFSTGVGSTDMAAGMSCGQTWLRVPAAIKVELHGKPRKWVSGKDVILHLIGLIGVDGARYMSLEFTGDGVANLSMDDRFTIANMAIEAGAKNGIFPVDGQTLAYIDAHKTGGAQFTATARPPRVYAADPDAEYERTVAIDLDALEPTVAFPHLPSNVRPVREAGDIRIDQVVINLLDNAIKFTPEGGKITLESAEKNGIAEITVRDSGIGVAPEDREKIFDRFFTADRAHTSGKGTGLGLSICRRIMEMHGQSIRLLDTEKGAAFRFTLQCVPREG